MATLADPSSYPRYADDGLSPRSMPMSDPTRFVWLDLEMTGLDDKSCVIIEMAMIVTDGNLAELALLEQCIWQPESALQTMTPFVRKMHTDNGLLDKVRASQTSAAEAEQKAIDVLLQHVGYKKGILAGNSIWQDRRFLLRHMPTFESLLHYRQIDVSTIKVLSKQWYGDAGSAPGKPSSHTALDDIRASINELRWYKENIFSVSAGSSSTRSGA
jgi:oligoribonuclease